MYEIKISDLRSLARFGNATVKLDQQFNYTIAEIKRDGIYIPHQAIKAQYAQKITEKIQEEYDTQTQALSNILQGKTDELKLRQRELNEGLKVNFSQAIDQFNHAHEEVIQNVEKQKDASPIEISKYLKAI